VYENPQEPCSCSIAKKHGRPHTLDEHVLYVSLSDVAREGKRLYGVPAHDARPFLNALAEEAERLGLGY